MKAFYGNVKVCLRHQKCPEKKKDVFLSEFWNSVVSLQAPSMYSCISEVLFFIFCLVLFPLHLPSVPSPTDFVSLHAGHLRMDPGLSSLLCLVWMAALPGSCHCRPPHCDGGQPELQRSLLRALPKILCDVQWPHPPLCRCPVSENCLTRKVNYEMRFTAYYHSCFVLLAICCTVVPSPCWGSGTETSCTVVPSPCWGSGTKTSCTVVPSPCWGSGTETSYTEKVFHSPGLSS